MLLIVLPLVLIIGASAALVTTLKTDKQLSDTQGRVTLTVPGTWTNDTTRDAGQRVEQGKRGEDSYTVPDLETGGLTGSVVVFIDDRATTPVSKAHDAAVDEECEVTGCTSRGQPTHIEVNGRPGTEQILRHPEEDSTVVLTLESEAFVVTVLGLSIEEDRPAIQEIMRTVAISR